MRPSRPILALVLAGSLSAVSAGAAVKEMKVERAAALTDGLILETLDGEAFDLGSLRGERTLIVTWASW